MTKQAEADEFRIYKAQLYKSLYGRQPRLNKRQRKRSDIDPDKYNQLVVADEQEAATKYESAYRGRVQDKSVEMTLMPLYELSYEPYRSDVSTYVAFDRDVDAFNRQQPTGYKIHINRGQTTLGEERTKLYFARIDTLSKAIDRAVDGRKPATVLFERAIAYSVIQNFEGALEDLTASISTDSAQTLAYWQKAVCQYKMNAFNASLGKDVVAKTVSVISDFDTALKYNQQNQYLYYNRGNVYADRKDYQLAIADYTKAIELDPNLAEAYYNRGLVRIFSDDVKGGVADLSKAGELGLYTAYSVIKRYSK